MLRTLLTSIIVAPLLWTGSPISSPKPFMNTTRSEKKISFTIECNLKEFKKKKAKVHIAWQEPWEFAEFLKIDMIDGKFKATGEISQPTLATIRIITFSDSLTPEQKTPWECDMIDFFISGGKTLVTGKDSLVTASIISTDGAKEQELFKSYTIGVTPIIKEMDSITVEWRKATAIKDTCTSRLLDIKYVLAVNKRQTYYQNFILQHPTSYVSMYVLNTFIYEVMDRTKLQIANSLLGLLSPSMRTSPIAAAATERLEQKLYPVVGKPVPQLLLTNNEQKKIDIAGYKGQVILVDFWASWCSPCIKEFPRLRTIYEKYKDKGFEILGVSIDAKKDAWIGAIEKYKLKWPHVIDDGPSFGGVASRKFRVQNVPAKFLVDRNGTIIARDLDLDELDKKLAALLEK